MACSSFNTSLRKGHGMKTCHRETWTRGNRKATKRKNLLPRNETNKEKNDEMDKDENFAIMMIETSDRMPSASTNTLGLNAVQPSIGSSFKAMNKYMIMQFLTVIKEKLTNGTYTFFVKQETHSLKIVPMRELG